jgi:CheY-like chemotaxis protein
VSAEARLKAHHYHTVFTADALQAMSVAQKDGNLLDLSLPGGNGLMVLDRLKSNTALRCIPVIIVTAEDL